MSKTKVERHLEIVNRLNTIYGQKNHDYGDAFALLRKEYPNAILYRLFDKYQRLKTLKSGATQRVLDESIRDTLLDMANYCILEVIEMDIEAEGKEIQLPRFVNDGGKRDGGARYESK